MLTAIFLRSASLTTAVMSATCCSGVLRSCSVTCLNEPLQSRFMTRQPADSIQSSDTVPSTNPSTSSLSRWPVRAAQLAMLRTASNSPSETRAEAISIRFTPKSPSSTCAMLSFSCAANETPEVCSPSRRVVSMISIIRNGLLRRPRSLLCWPTDNRCRRVR